MRKQDGRGECAQGHPSSLLPKQLWIPDCTLKSIGLGWACVARISQALTVSCEGQSKHWGARGQPSG